MADEVEENERAVIGGNNPPLGKMISLQEGDFAAVTTIYLEDDYAKQPDIVQSLLDEASKLMRDPATGEIAPIPDDDTKGKVASLIKRMRDTAKALAAFHGKEKQPYFRGGQAVDQYFFGMIDKLARRDKKNRPGAADVLGQMLTDYDNRKLAEEQERRRLAAAEAARVEREAREKREREERAAEEARLAAERARKPETKAAKEEVAQVAEEHASAARVEETVAAQQAQAAAIDTYRKPADIMRTRGDDGTLSTMGTEKYAEITDRTLLDLAKLGPYIPLDGLQKALNAWAKATDYREEMPGAAVGRRNKSLVK